MGNCCKGLTVLLDTRLATHPTLDLRNSEKENVEFQNLLIEILSKGSNYHFVRRDYNSKALQNEGIRRIYNELFCQSKPYNPVFIYDESDYLRRIELYATSIQNLTRYEDVFSRLLDLNYKYLVQNSMFGEKDISSILSRITQLQDMDTLVPFLLRISKLVHEKLLRELSGFDVIQPLLDLSFFNWGDTGFEATDVLHRIFHCLNAPKNILEHGIVILSGDPTEPYGGMCRYWSPDLPFLLFSPYYMKIFSALTFAHEIGHLIHYKNTNRQHGPNVSSPVVEEFFAVYAELICLRRNFLGLSKSISNAIFWQRIWYLVVRQFQIFLFEKLNLSDSQHTNLNSDILTYNWRRSWELILGESLKVNDFFLKSWLIPKGPISMPFRSISYVLATIIVLWFVLQDVDLTQKAYTAIDMRSLFCHLNLPPVDIVIQDSIRLIQ